MYKLFLDDIRAIKDVFKYVDLNEWIIVRNYNDFVLYIEKNGLPTFVSFDHDLSHEHYRQSMYNPDEHYNNYYINGIFKEKTGYDAAKFLVAYCVENNLNLPQWNVHSMNPIGRENIISLLENYNRT